MSVRVRLVQDVVEHALGCQCMGCDASGHAFRASLLDMRGTVLVRWHAETADIAVEAARVDVRQNGWKLVEDSDGRSA